MFGESHAPAVIGRWHVAGSTIQFTGLTTLDRAYSFRDMTGTVLGDSILFDPDNHIFVPWSYVYRRSNAPVPAITDGTYVLFSIDGRTDLVTSDFVFDGIRTVSRVAFDSITFFAGMFLRRHRYEGAVTYIPGRDSILTHRSWADYGSFSAAAGALVLREYVLVRDNPPVDTLYIRAGQLVRRRQTYHPLSGDLHTVEDLYRRLRE